MDLVGWPVLLSVMTSDCPNPRHFWDPSVAKIINVNFLCLFCRIPADKQFRIFGWLVWIESPWFFVHLCHSWNKGESLRRFDSSWGLRIYFLSNARDKTKNIFLHLFIELKTYYLSFSNLLCGFIVIVIFLNFYYLNTEAEMSCCVILHLLKGMTKIRDRT